MLKETQSHLWVPMLIAVLVVWFTAYLVYDAYRSADTFDFDSVEQEFVEAEIAFSKGDYVTAEMRYTAVRTQYLARLRALHEEHVRDRSCAVALTTLGASVTVDCATRNVFLIFAVLSIADADDGLVRVAQARGDSRLAERYRDESTRLRRAANTNPLEIVWFLEE